VGSHGAEQKVALSSGPGRYSEKFKAAKSLALVIGDMPAKFRSQAEEDEPFISRVAERSAARRPIR